MLCETEKYFGSVNDLNINTIAINNHQFRCLGSSSEILELSRSLSTFSYEDQPLVNVFGGFSPEMIRMVECSNTVFENYNQQLTTLSKHIELLTEVCTELEDK
jgi:hypothetical protein